MWIFGMLFGLFVFATSLILPWVNRGAIHHLREKVDFLQTQIDWLKENGAKAPTASATAASPVTEDRPEKTVPWLVTQKMHSANDFDDDDEFAAPEARPAPIAARSDPKAAPHSESKSFEQQFGGRAFVWLGGIALALAGFFLVKYSIESGFLTEQVRTILGLAFGIVLLGSSHIVRQHPRLADGTRISQALAGAGIADLYGCLFAATTLYHLIPSWLGFACMAAVTGTALVLSLRYGAPIAALGLIGGFVTPMLIHGEPNAPLLFGYLYLVFGSLIAVARRQDWWWLAIPATLVAFLWVIVWLANGMAAADAIWLTLFLIGISTAIVFATSGKRDEEPFGPFAGLRFVAIGGALLLMGTIAYTAHFDAFEWDMFGLLSVGALVLAWFDNRTYGFAPWIAMGANAVMLLSWNYINPAAFAIAVAVFGLMFVASGYVLAARSKNPVSWTGLSAMSAVIYFLLAYHKLDATISLLVNAPDWLYADQIWADIAFALAALFTVSTTQSFVARAAVKQRHELQAIFTVTATGLLSLGFAILLHQEYLAFAIAAEILAISWINTKVDIPALRYIAQALAILFGILLLPEMLALLASPFDDSSSYTGSHLEKFHTVSSLVFQFGLPSVMFAGTSWLLRDQRDDEFVMALELAALTLFGAMSYNLIGTIFAGLDHQTAFAARGIFTDVLIVLGLVSLRVGRQYDRSSIEWGGLIALGLATARIAGFDLLIHNPLWSHQMVGELPIMNGLILAYGLPALLIIPIRNELSAAKYMDLAFAAKVAGFILAFVFVSFNVRQFYHGAYLEGGLVSNAEVYTYSAAWLALGITMLFAGTMREDGMMRVASLLIMLLTVGKVFLYDASELTGLWRVVSFLGLGLSLLGLSWFYSRYVFGNKQTIKR